MMVKEQDCTFYEPGFITKRTIVELDNLMSRVGKEDNQRRTEYNYIYADDALLNGV